MRVLVCGSRYWVNKKAIQFVLVCLNDIAPIDTVIEGEAKGADRLAAEVARELGFTVLSYPAKWSEFGPPAGTIRNKQMIDEGKPNIIVAFHNDIVHGSRGTKHMITQAKRENIPYLVCSEDGVVDLGLESIVEPTLEDKVLSGMVKLITAAYPERSSGLRKKLGLDAEVKCPRCGRLREIKELARYKPYGCKDCWRNWLQRTRSSSSRRGRKTDFQRKIDKARQLVAGGKEQ